MSHTSFELPLAMMPREKLLTQGARQLSDVELLALFLRTGVAGKNVFQLADELLTHFKGLAGLMNASAQELAQVKGLGGSAKRAQLLGAVEMVRRAMAEELKHQTVLNAPSLVKSFLQIEIGSLDHEVFGVLFLDNQNHLLFFDPMFRGSLNQTMVYPREIAKVALQLGANGVVLAHNHPSGLVTPSHSDIELTRHLRQALQLIDVHIRDHIIVAPGRAFSMAEAGLL